MGANRQFLAFIERSLKQQGLQVDGMKKTSRLGLLAEALRDQESFVGRGFTIKKSARSLLVERHGHFHGIWTADEHEYVWTTAGYSEPSFNTGSLPEAVQYTLTEIAKH